GNLTSQFWANCYLNEFDHFVTRELGCAAYLRFVDDFLLFADDKRTLWAWKQAVSCGRVGADPPASKRRETNHECDPCRC
ncbi:MAG: RNA-directed DNA polymerase, partial [Anaerolineae bacterium]|uniref:RNA-directed DNA polymerase n=1 Tax=Candidatus Amarolinea dominans TaxID=3140696 RepID=UPI0031357C87|nr:RNA-directed DNA polymerase [Anaerolineae bacterium]